MAVTVTPTRSGTGLHTPWKLYTCVAGTVAIILLGLTIPSRTAVWASLVILTLSGWFGFDWARSSVRDRARAAIRMRLSRLPDDFYLLHDLIVPAPWGESRIDAVIISRFGIVVIGIGPNPGWMTGGVEAVRSLLFAYGVARPSTPLRPLVLMPPGAAPPRRPQYPLPAISVEHLRLQHLAPGGEPVLTADQVETIAYCLLQARAAS